MTVTDQVTGTGGLGEGLGEDRREWEVGGGTLEEPGGEATGQRELEVVPDFRLEQWEGGRAQCANTQQLATDAVREIQAPGRLGQDAAMCVSAAVHLCAVPWAGTGPFTSVFRPQRPMCKALSLSHSDTLSISHIPAAACSIVCISLVVLLQFRLVGTFSFSLTFLLFIEG